MRVKTLENLKDMAVGDPKSWIWGGAHVVEDGIAATKTPMFLPAWYGLAF